MFHHLPVVPQVSNQSSNMWAFEGTFKTKTVTTVFTFNIYNMIAISFKKQKSPNFSQLTCTAILNYCQLYSLKRDSLKTMTWHFFFFQDDYGHLCKLYLLFESQIFTSSAEEKATIWHWGKWWKVFLLIKSSGISKSHSYTMINVMHSGTMGHGYKSKQRRWAAGDSVTLPRYG
jgi:hypothetical protein